MVKKIGEFKVKRKEVVSVEAYNIPDPAYTDLEGRQYVIESDFRSLDYIKSDLHLSGRVPISLVSIGDDKRIDLTVPVPDERLLGLEDVVKEQNNIIVRLRNSGSTTQLVPYNQSHIQVIKFTEIPKNATLKHYIDNDGRFIGSLARGFGIRGASMSISELETGKLISKGSFGFDSGLWDISNILFGKNHACLVHSNKTESDPFCDPDDIRDYISIVDLKTGEFKTHIIQDGGYLHSSGFPVIFGKYVAVPLEYVSYGVSKGERPVKAISVVDLETLTVKTHTKLDDIFGKKEYSLLFGISDDDKAYFIFSKGKDYAVATVDSESNVVIESNFKGPSLRKYNFLGESYNLNRITNLDINDGIISALIRPKNQIGNLFGIPFETPEDGLGLYALAIGYDTKTKEASFFALPAPGVEISVSEVETVHEFFQGNVGMNIPLLQIPENKMLK